MQRKSIFIVENEIITAQGLAKNLKQLGYKVAGIATSGSQALARIIKLQPDLVLIDILLKKNDIDGITTAQKIQEKLNIPIVYLTAHSDEPILQRAKLTKPFGYILKPYSLKNLEITIEIALYKHHQELKLVEREKLLSNILNSTKDGVIATNKASETIYMNPAAEELTGWKISEALGQKAAKIVRIIDIRNNRLLANPIEQVLQQGTVIYLDEYAALIAKDGRKIGIQDSASPIIKENNRIDGAVLIFATTSQSVAWMEREKVTTPTTTATSVTTNEPETSVVCQKLNELNSSLIDLILHELRTPLTIILSTSESLKRYRKRWTEDKQNRSLNRIQQAIQQMTILLDDFTTWEQAGTGKLTFDPEPTEVFSWCEKLLSYVRLVDDNNHELILTYQGNKRIVNVDQTLLKYILNNLLFNAIKYSPQDSPVSLLLNYQENCLALQVTDRGRGIPPEEQQYIFDCFYRAHNVRTIFGTGLGLTIVKMCVELHQGEIRVDSKMGEDTTFTVTLPVS